MHNIPEKGISEPSRRIILKRNPVCVIPCSLCSLHLIPILVYFSFSLKILVNYKYYLLLEEKNALLLSCQNCKPQPCN